MNYTDTDYTKQVHVWVIQVTASRTIDASKAERMRWQLTNVHANLRLIAAGSRVF